MDEVFERTKRKELERRTSLYKDGEKKNQRRKNSRGKSGKGGTETSTGKEKKKRLN